MCDVFKEVKERVPAEEVARRFGLEFQRAHWCKCPFHQDTNASMSFKNGRWHCWVCNDGGDSIDLAARLLHLKPMRAAQRLNLEFGLGLNLQGQPTEEDLMAVRRRKRADQTFRDYKQWEDDTLLRLRQCIQAAARLLETIQSPEDYERLSKADIQAIQDQAYLEELQYQLIYGDPGEQMELFRNRKGIFTRTEKILNPTQRKCAKP